MNEIRRNVLLRGLVLIIVMSGWLGGVRDVVASHHEGWTAVPDASGCIYESNGFGYFKAACQQANGIINFFRAEGGQWVYTVSMYPSNDGKIWVYYPDGTGWIGYEQASTVTITGGGSAGDLTVHDIITNITRDSCLSGEDVYRDACS